MGPKQLAEVVWALAQLQVVPDVGFLDALAAQILAKLPGFTAEQLASSLGALATLGYVPGTPLLEAAAGALGRNLGLFSPRHACQAMWAFARMEFRPPAALLDAVLQMLSEALPSFTGEQLHQLTWAYAQFGHPPPPQMLQAMLTQAEACIGSLPPASLGPLLGGLIGLGVGPPGGLLAAAAELAVANMGSSGPAALVELLQVYARLKFHPGVTLLHSAAQHIASKLSQASAAAAAGSSTPPAHRLPAAALTSLLQSYATLAYAPPKALLQQLRQQLQPQVAEADPSALASALWCFCLFKDLSPELWNGAMGLLAQPAVAGGMTPGALSQLYQAYLMICKNPDGASLFTIPPQLILTAWQAFKAAQEAAVAAPPSDLIQDVARCLASLGIPYALNMVSEDGLLALKLALPERRVAIEVFEAGCFCANQQQPLGETVMRIQLLQACQWQPVTVPYYEWLPLGSDTLKQAYLRSMLGLPGPQ
ncbi:hypothetical protein OEZ86_004630 [Tetradesmus obliquus]|nr:hypothetical protein OEZ86_004630 [Tetradesmus obliquus]